jgi:hypothetical protein
MKVKFKHWDCKMVSGRYSNGRTVLALADEEGPVAVATVNVPEEPLGPDEVCVKDYSENEGMVAALVEAGVVEPLVVRRVRQGFVEIPVCRLTEKARAFVEGR